MSNAKIATEIASQLRKPLMDQQEALVASMLSPVLSAMQGMDAGFRQAAIQMRRSRRDTFAIEAMKTLLPLYYASVRNGTSPPEDSDPEKIASICYTIAAQMEKYAQLSEQAESASITKAVGSREDEANQG